MVKLFAPMMRVVIYAIPAVACAALIALAPSLWSRVVAIAVVPLVASTALVVTAGLLSVPSRRAIIAGKFPRSLSHPVYGPRRLYGLCWTSVYYAGPLYQLALITPWLRWLMLRLFGYRGAMNVTFYADTWLRDLPLLDVGEGAYLSNRATIGTNICLQTGDILVDRVTIGARAMVGHLAMLAPGAVLGEAAEIGVGVAFGIKARAGARCRVGPGCVINHGARLGDDVEVGTMAYVGAGVSVADGIKIPEGAIIPSRAVISSQADANAFARMTVSARVAA